MRRREIERALRDAPEWVGATASCKDAFIAQMEGRRYGWDALTQAWGWFHAGWRAMGDKFWGTHGAC